MNVGGDSNIQVGKNINYKKISGQKPDGSWRLIWTGILVGLVVAVIIGVWNFLT